MLRIVLIILLTPLLVFCSTDYEKNAITTISSTASQGDAERAETVEEDEEEEITAIVPTVISGAYLACLPVTKNESEQNIDLSCHLEKEGEVLEEPELHESDITVKDDHSESLVQSFSRHEGGSYLIKATLRPESNINLSLVSIQGNVINREADADVSRFDSVITVEQIAATEDIGLPEMEEETPPEEPAPETTTRPTDCNALGGEGTWVTVPGNSEYGTGDFCVMKYEAKCSEADGMNCLDADHSPQSTPENTPWVNISQEIAKLECASLGPGFHLITNEEWMTIGDNIVKVNDNWNNVNGSMQLNRGHSDNSPPQACAASGDDLLNVVEDTCESQAASADDLIEKRTHTLSNGQVIWDLSGNVWEWTSFFSGGQKPSPTGMGWFEFPDLVGSDEIPLSTFVPRDGLDNGWGSLQSIGQYYPGRDGLGGALRRGGRWQNDVGAGLFSAALDHARAYAELSFGFRCAYTLP